MTRASLLLLALAAVISATPVRLIFDTDIGNDIDDALALAMIHAMESAGEAKLLAVTVTKDNPWAGPYVDIINTFYGRPLVPIGTVRDGRRAMTATICGKSRKAVSIPIALPRAAKLPMPSFC